MLTNSSNLVYISISNFLLFVRIDYCCFIRRFLVTRHGCYVSDGCKGINMNEKPMLWTKFRSTKLSDE